MTTEEVEAGLENLKTRLAELESQREREKKYWYRFAGVFYTGFVVALFFGFRSIPDWLVPRILFVALGLIGWAFYQAGEPPVKLALWDRLEWAWSKSKSAAGLAKRRAGQRPA